ncbi:MAG: glycosyltransferase family 2 protein, partial [Bacteroidia bacterium]
MKPSPVSVIVPNYNHAAYLRQRLDSIFQQTFQDFEVILLDDRSADHSVEILQAYAQQYAHKVTHLVVNEENTGNPFVQWKKGIELAQGEFIWIAESDDFCEPTLLETLYRALQDKPSVPVAAANLIQVDAQG